jgi:hypothetical protein
VPEKFQKNRMPSMANPATVKKAKVMARARSSKKQDAVIPQVSISKNKPTVLSITKLLKAGGICPLSRISSLKLAIAG